MTSHRTNPYAAPKTRSDVAKSNRGRVVSILLPLLVVVLTLYLLACPIIIRAIAVANWRGNVPYGDPTFSPAPREWVERCFMADLVFAAMLVVLSGCFGRGWTRWLTMVGVLVVVGIVLFFTFLVYIEAAMATTGLWL